MYVGHVRQIKKTKKHVRQTTVICALKIKILKTIFNSGIYYRYHVTRNRVVG